MPDRKLEKKPLAQARMCPEETIIVVEHEDGHQYAFERTDYNPNIWSLYVDGHHIHRMRSQDTKDVLWDVTRIIMEEVPK